MFECSSNVIRLTFIPLYDKIGCYQMDNKVRKKTRAFGPLKS